MRIRTGTGWMAGRTYTAYGWSKRTGVYAFAAVYNALAAMGAACTGVEAEITIPADTCRTGRPAAGRIAHDMEKALEKACRQQGAELSGVHVSKNLLLSVPAVAVTGAGEVSEAILLQDRGPGGEHLRKGQEQAACDEIVLTKWIGMEGMLRIMEEREDELKARFAPVFLRQICSYRDEIFAEKELEAARRVGITVMRQITEGGIFAALWELSKETGMGLDLDMKRIPILQETIEVCEYFRLNPYQLTSAGSFLMAAPDGKRLADVLYEEQIPAAVIGRLTAGNDKVLRNGGDIRFLDRPAPDEIYRLFI